MSTANGLLSTVKSEDIITFKCEGCGIRFPQEKLWYMNYRSKINITQGSPTNLNDDALQNYVCSKKCSGLAALKKFERGETLHKLRKIESSMADCEDLLISEDKLTVKELRVVKRIQDDYLRITRRLEYEAKRKRLAEEIYSLAKNYGWSHRRLREYFHVDTNFVTASMRLH